MSDSDLYSRKSLALDSLVQWGYLTREEYFKCMYALTQKTMKVRIEEDGSGTVYFDGDPLADDETDYDNEYKDDEYEDDEYIDEDDDTVAPEPVFVKAGDVAYEDENLRLTYRGIRELRSDGFYFQLHFIFIIENLSRYSIDIHASVDLNGFTAEDDAPLVRELKGNKKTADGIAVFTNTLHSIYICSYEDLKKIQIAFTYKISELNYEKETVANEYEIIRMS